MILIFFSAGAPAARWATAESWHKTNLYVKYIIALGAAVRSKSGKIYTGCNIENASYGLSMCAERVAIFKAVSAGDPEIIEIALFTDAEKPSRPCGACRQVLFEFAKIAAIIMGNKGSVDISNIQKLFPEPYKLDPHKYDHAISPEHV